MLWHIYLTFQPNQVNHDPFLHLKVVFLVVVIIQLLRKTLFIIKLDMAS